MTATEDEISSPGGDSTIDLRTSALPHHRNSVAIESATSTTASARVIDHDGRRVMMIRVAGSGDRGALSPTDAAILESGIRTGREKRIPILAVLSTNGVSAHDGMASVVGWGRAARELVKTSGVVPVLMTATGSVVSGPALLLGLADVTVFTDETYAFVSGPHMVESFTGNAPPARR